MPSHTLRNGRTLRATGHHLTLLLGGATLLALGACDEAASSPVAPDQTDPVSADVAGNLTGWDLPLRGLGQLRRVVPGQPCTAPEHREFDFWVGEWNVLEPNTGNSFGTNAVTTELDGCVVREEYTANNGVKGFSLNAYDRETESWHQSWVSQIPQSFITRLRTMGGLRDGVMVLEGRRDGVFNGTPFSIQDEWSWTPTPEGHVIQTGFAFAGPPFNQVLTSFAARYERGPISPAAPLDTPLCDAGGPGVATRDGDFLLGEWTVRGYRGPTLATSTIETDLSRCLFVERFQTPRGIEAVTYTYWDRWNDQWYWIWVDNQGERMQLTGLIEGEQLVLYGDEHLNDELVEVRLTITPGDEQLQQMWEVSRDGGEVWERGAVLEYVRR